MTFGNGINAILHGGALRGRGSRVPITRVGLKIVNNNVNIHSRLALYSK